MPVHGLGVGSGLLGGIGSILGGGAAANGADNAADYLKNIMSWLKDEANDKYRKSRKDIYQNRRDVLGESRELRRNSQRTADKARDANTGILTRSRDQSIGAVRGDRRDGMRDIRGNRRANLADIGRTSRDNLGDIDRTAGRNIGDINRTARESLADIGQTERQNLRTASNQLGESLGYFNPAIQQGNNALSAFSQMLGLSRGRYDMALTPATQYLMDQGRDTIEGGAAGAGGLYSGETLAELEKMRTGLVSQDYQTQMAQIMGLVGVGQNAGNSAAALRSGFADDAATYRTSARDAGVNVRGAASDRRLGVRGDASDDRVGVRGAASDARLGVRDDSTQALLGLRDATTGQMNALRQFYNPALVGVNDMYANRSTSADTNYANMNTSAYNNALQNLLGARELQMQMKMGAGTSLAPTAADMIAGKGAAKAGGIIGATNALMGGIGNMAYSQGVQAGGAPMMPGVSVGGGSPYATAPGTAMPWLQQQYQLPQPPAGGSWVGSLYNSNPGAYSTAHTTPAAPINPAAYPTY
jgi:hypothetical protein